MPLSLPSVVDPFKIPSLPLTIKEHNQDLLQKLNIPWNIETCVISKRPFIQSTWNKTQEGAFRSPWIAGTERNRLEINANEVIQTYVQLYYENPDTVSSFFITSADETEWSFIVAIQSESSIATNTFKSQWNSIHEGKVQISPQSKSATYSIQSKVFIRSRDPGCDDGSKTSWFSISFDIPSVLKPPGSTGDLFDSQHIKHIGMAVESAESKIRLSLVDIHLQAPQFALKSAYKSSCGFSTSPKTMNLACQAEFLRKVQSRNDSNNASPQ